jgi:nucleoid-associated protein EbfC
MNIQQAMKQAQALQTKMGELQKQLEQEVVEGKAGGGLVKVLMTCKGEIRKVDLNVSIINLDEKEVLEDLIVAASNNAKQSADEKTNEEMKKIASALGIPSNMLNLPF